MKKYSIEKASCVFSGFRSMGLFAPLSYWRSDEDWGIGDMDVLLKLIDFAKKFRISIISLLPLNIPRHDNCPYANASAYVFDPVYIGISMMLREFGMEKGGLNYSPEIYDLISSLTENIENLRKRSTSSNHEIRECKYKILKAVFNKFEEKFSMGISDIADMLAGLPASPIEKFKSYCLSNEWLGDHLLFFILAKEFHTDNFRKWPENIARRSPETIQCLKEKYKSEILFEAFLQWIITQQIEYVRKKAAEGDFKVDIMLDQPFAFGHADVWCSPGAFIIDPLTLKTEYTQGAPPHRLDIPQHWQFYLLNTDSPESKDLMLKRLCFFLKFSDLLRIDHVLGYYRLYYMTEDENQDMTLEKMGIWDEIKAAFKSSIPVEEKREKIYNIIIDGVKANFPKDVQAHLFDGSGLLKHAHVILAARRNPVSFLDRAQSGWYTQGEYHEGYSPLYTLLSPNEYKDMDYLKKIIEEKEMFLLPSDSIRAGFFKPGYGEEIMSAFMHAAQLQGKTLIFESLGVVPEQISLSLEQLGAAEFKPLFFGYQYFTGDENDFWFNHIKENSYVCFSTQDTVTIRGWWEGREKWAEKKYYFKNAKQKQSVINWLIQQGFLSENAEIDLENLNSSLLDAVLESVLDSRGNFAVIMMSNIFGSGDEGIINMPGYSGFWTARAPLSIESMMLEYEHKDHTDNPAALEAVERIKFLVQKKDRHDFKNQIKDLDASFPHILATHPIIGSGSKQVRLYGEDFLIDAVIYGKCFQVSLLFENGRREPMKKLEVDTGLFPGLNIFRSCIPVNQEMIAVSQFQIDIDGNVHHDKGYLIGCLPGTDMNPISERYGKSRI